MKAQIDRSEKSQPVDYVSVIDILSRSCYNLSNMAKEMTKASQTCSLLVSDLQHGYREASPLEEIVLRQLLQQAVELERRLQEFANAVNAEQNLGT